MKRTVRNTTNCTENFKEINTEKNCGHVYVEEKKKERNEIYHCSQEQMYLK